jgi:hypothetical protein
MIYEDRSIKPRTYRATGRKLSAEYNNACSRVGYDRVMMFHAVCEEAGIPAGERDYLFVEIVKMMEWSGQAWESALERGVRQAAQARGPQVTQPGLPDG